MRLAKTHARKTRRERRKNKILETTLRTSIDVLKGHPKESEFDKLFGRDGEIHLFLSLSLSLPLPPPLSLCFPFSLLPAPTEPNMDAMRE
jgi:hypothetical protein